ncbi:uncharacterized protein CBL_02213 [Carabus blaptoides fortunei]
MIVSFFQLEQIEILYTLVIVTIFVQISVGQNLISPCPSLFEYEPEGVVGDRWYGNIRITADSEYSGLWMRMIFDRPFPELGSDFGEVVQREPSEFLIRRPKNKIAAGETVSIRIFARYNPGDVPPKLLGFRLNGRTVCPENGMIATTIAPLSAQLVSPCPRLFEYEPPGTETDRWYGTIQIKSNRELSGVWLRIVLDRPSIQLGVSEENWFGEVKTEDNIEYLVKNRNQKVKPGDTVPIRFFIKYNPAEPVPKLATFRLNAETVCPEGAATTARPPTRSTTQSPADIEEWITLPPPDTGPAPDIFGSDFDPNSRPTFLPGSSRPGGIGSGRFPCGTVAAKPRPLITHGEVTREGQWPWHAALYYPKGIDLQYICGASLISLNHVLTAGHCVARKQSNTAVANDDIEVYLGKYLLRKFSNKGIQNVEVKKITMHPEYNYRTYVNDIAVIHLARPAEYTDYVRPVCLWSENVALETVVHKEGTVVGWGYDHSGRVTEHLTKATMPVIEHVQCIWSYPDFFSKFVSNRTLCAGFRNGTSVCNGDSGGGLVFPKTNSNPNQPIWHIRGVVSISVALQSEFICDTSHYAIFTDVAKYLQWIRNVMSSS